MKVCTCNGSRSLAEEDGGVLVCQSCGEVAGHPAAELVAARIEPRLERVERILLRIGQRVDGNLPEPAIRPPADAPLRTSEAAHALGLSEAKIRKNPRAYGGYKLPGAGPKGHWLFPAANIRALAEGRV